MINISVLEALVEAGVSAAQLLTAVKAMNSSTCHEAEPRGAFDVAKERYIRLREGDDDHPADFLEGARQQPRDLDADCEGQT